MAVERMGSVARLHSVIRMALDSASPRARFGSPALITQVVVHCLRNPLLACIAGPVPLRPLSLALIARSLLPAKMPLVRCRAIGRAARLSHRAPHGAAHPCRQSSMAF